MQAEPLHAARLAALESAVLALLREVQEGGDGDGLSVIASADNGQCAIDIHYTRDGTPTAGFSL